MPLTPKPQLIHRLPISIIASPLLILIFGTGYSLFLSSDKNVESLWSQCSAGTAQGILSHLSHIPLLGPPSCFLVSFFTHALSSSRSFAIMSCILSFVGSLLTISTVESARLCNFPNPLIRNPTLPWLFFNLAGGAVAWQVVIVPAFIHRARKIHDVNSSAKARKSRASPELESRREPAEIVDLRDYERGRERRYLHNRAEIYSIPLSIALGYALPSFLMLVLRTPLSVCIWLFFPLWVSLLRQGIRWLLVALPLFPQFTKEKTDTHYLESNYRSLGKVYALPVLLSVVSQVIVVKSLMGKDDGSEMTRAALRFIEIDFSAIAVTVFYWLLLDAGWKILGISLLCSVVAGPGAGLVLGWILKEKSVGNGEGGDEDEGRDGNHGDVGDDRIDGDGDLRSQDVEREHLL